MSKNIKSLGRTETVTFRCTPQEKELLEKVTKLCIQHRAHYWAIPSQADVIMESLRIMLSEQENIEHENLFNSTI